MDNLIIYVISDSVGETAQQVTKAALSQFNAENDCEIRRFPYVADEKFLMEVLESGKNEGAIIVYTLVSENLLNIAKNFCDKEELSHVDLMTPLLKQISNKTGVKPKREPGIIRKLDESYFKRVEAIEFAVKYDDGKDPRGILKSDIVLLGISRTSKTPLSMYLANKNIKVANVPLVPEIPIPKEVFEIDDNEILSAMRWHTTGKENMTSLEKIIYLADLIEPSRKFEGVDRLREISEKDLNLAVLEGLTHTTEYLLKKNQPIDINSMKARNYLLYTKQNI